MVRVYRTDVKLQNYTFLPEGHQSVCTLTLASVPSTHGWKSEVLKAEIHMLLSTEDFSLSKEYS